MHFNCYVINCKRPRNADHPKADGPRSLQGRAVSATRGAIRFSSSVTRCDTRGSRVTASSAREGCRARVLRRPADPPGFPSEDPPPVVHADHVDDLPCRLPAVIDHRQQDAGDGGCRLAHRAAVAIPAQQVRQRFEAQILGADRDNQVLGNGRDALRQQRKASRRIDDDDVEGARQRADDIGQPPLRLPHVAERLIHLRQRGRAGNQVQIRDAGIRRTPSAGWRSCRSSSTIDG